MTDMAAIREHMEVVGADGQHVGVVDKVDGDRIKLTRKDPQAQGQHHYVPLDWVGGVDQVVRLNRPSAQVMQEWQSDDTTGDAGSRANEVGGAMSMDDSSYAANRERSLDGEVF